MKDIKNRKKKRFLILIGMIIFSCFCGVILIIISETPYGKTQATEIVQEKTLSFIATQKAPTLTPTPDPNILILIETLEMTETEAQTALEIINNVGFDHIKSLEFFQEIDNTKAYLAMLGYTQPFLITIVDNQIFGISSENYVFYDRDAGGVLDNINNYTIDTTKQSTFMYLTEEYVKQSLKAPSTAKFPGVMFELDKWSIGRNHDIVTVRSYVDAENSFGAKIRSTFTAQYSYDTEKLLYLEIDGKIMFGNLQNP